jgi:hypothetical protein
MKGSFTTYNNDIMQFKEKKSAFFALQIKGPEINFLKKKVMEMVNFLMILLKQVGILGAPEAVTEKEPKEKPSSNSMPLRYCVEIISPKICLFRSSLSNEGFKSTAFSIELSNYKKSLRTQETDEREE